MKAKLKLAVTRETKIVFKYKDDLFESLAAVKYAMLTDLFIGDHLSRLPELVADLLDKADEVRAILDLSEVTPDLDAPGLRLTQAYTKEQFVEAAGRAKIPERILRERVSSGLPLDKAVAAGYTPRPRKPKDPYVDDSNRGAAAVISGDPLVDAGHAQTVGAPDAAPCSAT